MMNILICAMCLLGFIFGRDIGKQRRGSQSVNH